MLHEHQRSALDVVRAISLPESGRVLDIGANVGLFAIALLAVRPKAHITSLEPNPAPFALLEVNARAARERGSDWTVLPVGIDTQNGTRTMWYVPGRSG